MDFYLTTSVSTLPCFEITWKVKVIDKKESDLFACHAIGTQKQITVCVEVGRLHIKKMVECLIFRTRLK